MEVGRGVVEMVAEYLRLHVSRLYRETVFENQGLADLGGEFPECLLHVREVAVDVEVVGVHGSDHCDRRVQLEERAVELVGLGYDDRGVADEHVGSVVPRNASEKG